MKEIKLTQGYVALVDDEDYEELNKYKWYPLRGKYTVYAYRSSIKYKNTLMHRLIINVTDKNVLIDHINGDGLNNQKSNLRLSNKSQNSANRHRLCSNNSTGYTGVQWHKAAKKWMAQIVFNQKKIYLGLYEDKDEAARVYDKKYKELFSDFCGKLNFPND